MEFVLRKEKQKKHEVDELNCNINNSKMSKVFAKICKTGQREKRVNI